MNELTVPCQIDLNRARHSAAHLLAAAIIDLFPNVKLGLGPPTDVGFYYDFELPTSLSQDDLPKIESRMRELAKGAHPFVCRSVSVEEARTLFSEQPYKLEIIEQLLSKSATTPTLNSPQDSDTNLTTYTVSYFEDLCKGPHVTNTNEIPIEGLRLDRVAGAYWLGDEKRPQLQRVYGLLFATQAELDHYLWQQDEALRRDHRRIGEDLELFTFAPEVGRGLPLWLPNGVVIRDQIESWAREIERRAGYQRVVSPHITRQELYQISGHLPYYGEDMYPPMEIDGDDYYLRPMNCPHHHMIYRSKPRSYKELPLRLAEYGTVYRYERSGQLSGLMRTRSFTQNDAHIYCSEEQARTEFAEVMRLHDYYYRVLGIEDFYMVLALPDPNRKDKYHGDEELWKRAEAITRDAIAESGIPFVEDVGGAAHYGPKIDFIIRSVTGREFAASTCQVDLFMPVRFDLTYTAPHGAEEKVVVLHRAPLGSHERFVGYLIEHFAGAFPVWLAPEQVRIVPITDKQVHDAYQLCEKMTEVEIRASVDDSAERMQAKIRKAELRKIPYTVLMGAREVQSGSVAIRVRGTGDCGQITMDAFIQNVKDIVQSKVLGAPVPTGK